MPRIKPIIFCTLVAVCLNSTPLAAADDAAQQELEAVTAAISEIEAWLASASQRQSAAELAVSEAELAISRINRSMAALEESIRVSAANLESLEDRQSELLTQRDSTSAILAQTLRAAYMAGESSFLKTLLNQEDPDATARMLHYARIFSEYQLQQIASYQSTLQQLDSVGLELTAELAGLSSQQQQLTHEAERLSALRVERQQAVTALAATISSRGAELEALQVSQAELQALLEEIARSMEGIRSFADVPSIIDRRGQLPAPLNGPLLSRFGSSYGGGSLTRQGILIGAEQGSPVRAVHPGYVAFANWLRGSGLLVVIDHGNGYLSLYAGNESLAAEAGSWVDSGDVIATSGRSPGSEGPGLYFELRREGTAVNPASWLDSGN